MPHRIDKDQAFCYEHKVYHPLADFRWKEPGKLNTICKAAEQERQVIRTVMKQEQVTADKFRTWINELDVATKKGGQTSVTAITSTMFNHFGGVDGLCKFWHSKMLDPDTSSGSLVQHMKTLMNLLMYANEKEGAKIDIDSLSDDEINTKIRELLAEEFGLSLGEEAA